MLVPGRVREALAGQAETLRQTAREAERVRDRYVQALFQLRQLSPDEVSDRLARERWPGARPTDELQERGLVIPFSQRWQSASEARLWALKVLRGIPTVGVDGSQAAASREFGVPLSLVQVAWFENYHHPDRPYVKNVRHEVVSVEEGASEIQEYAGADSKLNQRRFVLEMQVARERLQALAGSRSPLVFVDGSLILSFAGRLAPASRQAYLRALFGLLDASEQYRVPVVGYVDLSYASDLVSMLRVLFDLPAGNIFDGRAIDPLLYTLGRTAAFICARGDVLPHYRSTERSYAGDLCFVYLKTGVSRLPARLDFPRWVLEDGLLDALIDIVRAEVVVGSGYPYALETADAAAVLTAADRLTFYRLFQEFVQASGLTTYLPAKTASKIRRR